MNVLMTPNMEILTVLKEQSVFLNKDYRLLNNCLIEDVEGGKILFNGLTRSIVFLSNLEFSEIYKDKDKYLFLYKYYFLVPEDFNEIEVIDIIKDKYRTPIDDFYLSHANAYTILTTTQCNARCFYCYESKVNQTRMSKDTAKKTADFIIKNAYRNNPVKLAWFGGEPLFNMKVIDIITSKLRDAGFKFFSDFTSNGYLFDKDLVIKAKNSWNINKVQITLDGTEIVYNRTKNYIYKTGKSPYKKVLENIGYLLDENIQVTIRLNLDKHNCDDLKDLIQILHNRFGNHPALAIYCWPIFENETFQRTEDERIFVYQKLEEVESLLNTCGYFFGTQPSNTVDSIQCMADAGNHFTVSPNGDLGVCEHCVDYGFLGHINSEEKNWDIIKSWREYEKPLDICNDCPLYGSCIRLVKCEEMCKCNTHIKAWKIRKARLGLRNFYKQSMMRV